MLLKISLLIFVIQTCFCVNGTALAPFKPDEIEFWDIDENNDLSVEEKASIKENIVSQLSGDFKGDANEGCEKAGCPRIYGPVICDNKGRAYTNICLYLCQKGKEEDLTPKKVLYNWTGGEKDKEICRI